MEKSVMKKLAYSIFVAIIFIGSYLAFGSVGTTPASATTTTSIPPTVYGIAIANATMLNYSTLAYVTISSSCAPNASAIANTLNYTIAGLRNSGEVSNYYKSGNTFGIYSNVPSNSIYNTIKSEMNSTVLSCLSFRGTVSVSLPSTLTFVISGQKAAISIPNSMRIWNMPVVINQNTANMLKVKVLALITENGTIYQMNVTGV